MIFKDKFQLKKAESIFLAKKNLVDNIYSGAVVEGINITFPETQAIVDGINVPRLNADEIMTVRNLKSAWRYTLKSLETDEKFSLDFVKKINDNVSRDESLSWGVLRTGNVFISGTDYVPPVPEEGGVLKKIEEIMSAGACTQAALDFYAYACRAQLFYDGNKRTAFICANKIMLDAGAGIIKLRDKNILEFNIRLSEFYGSGNPADLQKFLYENCIESM